MKYVIILVPLLLYARLHRSIYPSVDQIICGSELRKIILRDEYNKRDDKLSLGWSACTRLQRTNCHGKHYNTGYFTEYFI